MAGKHLMTELGLEHVLAAGMATLLIALVKGAFGGGFGLVGIPLLSLVMDPISAGAIIAPLFIPMDLVALRYFPPRTWSKPDIRILVPDDDRRHRARRGRCCRCSTARSSRSP